MLNVWIATWLCNILISFGGDIQLNPGPKDKSSSAFSICHWTLNSTMAHKYVKVSLHEAYIAVQNLIYVFPKHTMTLALRMMMVIWESQGNI